MKQRQIYSLWPISSLTFIILSCLGSPFFLLVAAFECDDAVMASSVCLLSQELFLHQHMYSDRIEISSIFYRHACFAKCFIILSASSYKCLNEMFYISEFSVTNKLHLYLL